LGNKCVFLDRDGVICVEVNYMREPSQFELLPKVGEALKLLKEENYRIVVVSNQSGVARGYITEEKVHEINNKMVTELDKYDVNLDKIYYCPHHPEGEGVYKKDCYCRKPKPGMLLRGAQELDIDMALSYMIGDRKSDIIAGKDAGCRTILVLTGCGKTELAYLMKEDNLKPDYVADDLYEASRIILKKAKR
jgi:D-glycero-D-manno-heptose 1,7-bisphosphate phosphatase